MGVGGVYREVAHRFILLFQEVMELVMLLMAWGIVQTPLPPGSGRCFSGIELNYPFSTRGPVCDLFLSHSYAPPSAAHGGSSGQGQRCGGSTLPALLFAVWAQWEGGGAGGYSAAGRLFLEFLRYRLGFWAHFHYGQKMTVIHLLILWNYHFCCHGDCNTGFVRWRFKIQQHWRIKK